MLLQSESVLNHMLFCTNAPPSLLHPGRLGVAAASSLDPDQDEGGGEGGGLPVAVQDVAVGGRGGFSLGAPPVLQEAAVQPLVGDKVVHAPDAGGTHGLLRPAVWGTKDTGLHRGSPLGRRYGYAPQSWPGATQRPLP